MILADLDAADLTTQIMPDQIAQPATGGGVLQRVQRPQAQQLGGAAALQGAVPVAVPQEAVASALTSSSSSSAAVAVPAAAPVTATASSRSAQEAKPAAAAAGAPGLELPGRLRAAMLAASKYKQTKDERKEEGEGAEQQASTLTSSSSTTGSPEGGEGARQREGEVPTEKHVERARFDVYGQWRKSRADPDEAALQLCP